MREIELDLSPKQKLRLRKGAKVRVKPSMEGMGCMVLMNPQSYDIVTRSFSRGKAKEIILSLDEIEANRSARVEGLIEGQGLFDSIKKGVSQGVSKVKSVTKKGVKAVDKFAKSKEGKALIAKGKKLGTQALDEGFKYAGEAGASLGTSTAIALGQPELVPAFALGGKEIAERLAPSARKAIRKKTGMGLYATASTPRGRGLRDGNDGYMARAGQQALDANIKLSELDGMGLYATAGKGLYATAGRGLYATSAPRGNGLYASSAPMRGMGIRMVGNTLSMTEGQVLGKDEVQLPHLLKSDPYGSSFHLQVGLPPQYHQFHTN